MNIQEKVKQLQDKVMTNLAKEVQLYFDGAYTRADLQLALFHSVETLQDDVDNALKDID